MMSATMHPYRDHSRPPSHGYGPYRGNGSGRDEDDDRHLPGLAADADAARRGRGPPSHPTQPPPRPPTSASTVRWAPPRGRRSFPGSGSSGGNGARGGNGGSGGGGKMSRQRRHSNDGSHSHRNQHQHRRPRGKTIITPDEPSADPSKKPATDVNEDMPKLDPSDPVHARRMQQRRRQVLFGKNTAGYEEYAKKVPRHKRRHRSPQCPMTPDHTLDIPTKRWQGLMNAWRRSLHQYDPPDLHLRQPAQNKITLAPRPCANEEDRAQEELAQAKAAGLQVAFDVMNVGREAGMFSVGVATEEGAATGESAKDGGAEEAPFDEEAAYRRAAEEGAEGGDAVTGFLDECESDSDDDLL
ncbi:hypothetical protein ACHAWF_003140 [Thalassiosira exigua]